MCHFSVENFRTSVHGLCLCDMCGYQKHNFFARMLQNGRGTHDLHYNNLFSQEGLVHVNRVVHIKILLTKKMGEKDAKEIYWRLL